jgi:xylulokinase
MDHEGVSEQVADGWKIAAMAALSRCVEGVRSRGASPEGLEAIAIDGTSGSIVLLDSENRPLYPGLMHNDTRSVEEAAHLNDFLAGHCAQVGYRFGPTFALSKLLWMKRHQPRIFERARRVAHQADFIVGELTGRFDISDPSNSLKTGYNLVTGAWPGEMRDLGVSHLLPQVVPSGSLVAEVSASIASDLGIPPATQVLAGVTDSTAAFLATGAMKPGEFSVSLGTTMAFKGVSESLVHDPAGVVYCHRHPGKNWLPGGASNVGGACLKALFRGRDLGQLDRAAQERFPTQTLCYPLVEVGERFPFNAPLADGFFDEPIDETDQFLSLLQGVALVEKWCLERFARLGINIRPPLYTAGQGSNSDVWNQVRANISQISLARSRSTDSAFGVAVLAASTVFYGGDLEKAGKAMTGITTVFEPDSKFKDWSEEQLGRLKQRCLEKGWITSLD